MYYYEIAFTNTGIRHVAIQVAKGQFLILLKIVCNNNRTDVMNFNEGGECHCRIGKLMLFVVLHHKRNFQELMKLRKCQHVDGKEQYADYLFHWSEGTKDVFSLTTCAINFFKFPGAKKDFNRMQDENRLVYLFRRIG